MVASATAFACVVIGCNDVGDNTGLPAGGDGSSADGTLGDGTAGDGPLAEAGDAAGEDAGEDAVSPEAGGDAAEASVPDARADSGTVDATVDSSPGVDSGADAPQDAPRDAPHEASTGPSACTSPPCAATGPGSLKCTMGNNPTTGVCTQMEAAFVNFDPTESCYGCMAGGGCFDAPHQPLVDCGDFTASFTNGAGTVLTASQAQSACLATLDCILASGTATAGGTCASNGAGVSWCYCNEAATTCAAVAPSSLTGACTATELAGFSYTTGGATPVSQQVLSAQTNATEPSGAATNALACAILNGCTSCY